MTDKEKFGKRVVYLASMWYGIKEMDGGNALQDADTEVSSRYCGMAFAMFVYYDSAIRGTLQTNRNRVQSGYPSSTEVTTDTSDYNAQKAFRRLVETTDHSVFEDWCGEARDGFEEILRVSQASKGL